MNMKNLLVLLFASFGLGGCSFSDSAMQYAQEGTRRSEAGYQAKIEMTKHLTAFLTEANKGCGVKVEIVNGTPITTVKDCIRLDDAMASVDKVQIIEPQRVKDVLESAGDFVMKATNLAVPVASVYYGYRNNVVNQNANVAIRQSDNEAQTSMWDNYTSNFENTTTNSNSVSNTNATTNTTEKTTTSDTSNTTTTNIPSVSVESNSTRIGG